MAHTGQLRVLIVGCGNIAGGFDAALELPGWPLTHAGAYQRHGGFSLAACVEPDAARRAAFMQRWKVPAGFADVDSMAAPPGAFDVVSICSPTVLHATHLENILALHPRLVFCEKPVTPDAASTARLVDACARQGVPLAINHTRRWAPDVLRLKEELATGRWGAVRSVTAQYNKGLLNNGAHLVDMLHLLLGPLEVQWAGPPVHDFWPQDPSVPAHLLACGSIPVHLGVSHAADYALFELQIVTQAGIVAMEEGGLWWRVRKAAPSSRFTGYHTIDGGQRIAGEYEQAMAGAVANLHAHLLTVAPLSSTGQTALLAQQVCEIIRHAAPAEDAQALQDPMP